MAVCAIKAVELPVKRRAALPYSERWLANPAAAVAEMPRNAPLTFTVATPDAGIFTLARSCSLPSAMKRIGVTMMGPVTSLFCNWMVEVNPASVRHKPQLIVQLPDAA